MIFLSYRQLSEIYGGRTQVVDANQFKFVDQDLVINNVNVLSASGDRFLPNQTVVIKQGIITSIDTTTFDESDYYSVDGAGKYLIPGLVDSHVHLFKSPNDLLLYVANGVTHIREMIGEPKHLQWRKEIEAGRIGPDMYIASPRTGSFKTLEGWFMAWSQGFVNIKNPAQAEKMVKKFYRKGYDGIKVYSYLNKPSYEAVNRTAMDLGMDVIGHIPWSVSLEDVWASNQSEIAHLEELMNALNRAFGQFNSEKAAAFLEYVENESAALADNLKQNNIHVTTTLWLTKSFVRQKFELQKVLTEVALAYENPGISEWSPYIPQGLGWLPEVNRYKLPDGLTEEEKTGRRVYWETYGMACQILLKNLAERGVKIVAGTDANLPPTVPGFSLHQELESMQEAGLSAAEVLQSATAVPAAWMKANAGTIEVNKVAQLVLLNENPLLDIQHTKSIETVILNGKLLDRNTLDQMLEAVKMANDQSRKKDISAF